MVTVVMRLKFRVLPDDPPAGLVQRGAFHVASDTIYVGPEDYHPAGDWFVLWPLGRTKRNRHAWVLAKRMARVEAVDEEAWIWVVPDDPVVDREALRPVWDALVAAFPTRTWTLRELNQDTGPVATAIKNNWQDERPRVIERTGGTDEEPIYTDRGVDATLEKIGVYRGLGAVRRIRPE